LQSAQQRVAAGDIEGGLVDYEAVVRANQALDNVEKDLDKLASSDAYKRNPSVHRVLGDVRMRQGKLQEALETYRRALNML
jgi:tetratricopeptide (TPR) repeat protein